MGMTAYQVRPLCGGIVVDRPLSSDVRFGSKASFGSSARHFRIN
jgi:hypothetical protein